MNTLNFPNNVCNSSLPRKFFILINIALNTITIQTLFFFKFIGMEKKIYFQRREKKSGYVISFSKEQTVLLKYNFFFFSFLFYTPQHAIIENYEYKLFLLGRIFICFCDFTLSNRSRATVKKPAVSNKKLLLLVMVNGGEGWFWREGKKANPLRFGISFLFF